MYKASRVNREFLGNEYLKETPLEKKIEIIVVQ